MYLLVFCNKSAFLFNIFFFTLVWFRALDCLPGELREKIVSSPETRNKFHHLYEGVNNLSTADVIKGFDDGLCKQNDKAACLLPVEEQNADCSVLDSCYMQLQSLIGESPAIEVHSKVKTLTGKDLSLG